MSESSNSGTPAGWYDDGQGLLRYWDGLAWTDHVSEPVQPAPEAVPDPTPDQVPDPTPVPAPTAAPYVEQQAPVFPQDPVPSATAAAATGGQPAVAQGLQMKRRNPLAAWLLLPIITLGIYHLVWYYKIHREMAEYDRRRQTPVAGPMLVLLFLGWTIVAPAISYHNAGQRVRDRQVAAGLVPSCSPALSWVLMFLFGFNTYYLQTELDKVVDVNAGVTEGTPVALRV